MPARHPARPVARLQREVRHARATATRPRVTLRPATLKDSARLLQWRNDPDTRRQSRSMDRVPIDAHRAWLSRVLKETETHLYVAEDRESHAVGTGRLDYRGQRTAELHLTVAADARGQGYAGEIIRALAAEAKRIGWTRLVARVKLCNVASMRAFMAAGFACDECLHFERES